MSDNATVEKKRWTLVLGTMALALGLISFAAWRHSGWTMAAWSAALINAIILGYVVVQKDGLIGRLWVFGMVAGIAELPSDHFSVAVEGVLTYPQEGPFIWTSPLYMPFGYPVLFVQLGFLARWLTSRAGMWKAVLLTGLIGGLNVPAQEYLAKGAGYWVYDNTTMLFATVPVFILVGEFVFAGSLPPIVRWLEKARWPVVVLLGLLEGLIMYVAWSVSFRIFD